MDLREEFEEIKELLGKYVILTVDSAFPGVQKGNLGRVAGTKYLPYDGTANVDFVYKEPDEVVNLNFEPWKFSVIGDPERLEEDCARIYRELDLGEPEMEKIRSHYGVLKKCRAD